MTEQQKQMRRIFTATLIIGTTGSGKTSLLATFARYLWETYGKVLFLYSWDGGAIPTEIQKCMKQGLIRFWRVRTRSATGLGIETLYLATKGYVPKVINPETGETSPAVAMVAPVVSKYTCSCKQGHHILTVPFVSLIQATYCNTCKLIVAPEHMNVVEESKRTKGLELIGGVAFDGLTSMSTVVMDHMDHARGAGDIGGEKPAFGGVVTSGSIKLGGNNRADVGFGQSRAQQFVNNSLSIPYLVEGPIFTALSAEASEDGLPIVGAKLPGRAATDEASSWFGNVCEATKTTDDAGKQHFTLRLRDFVDNQGRKHLLKTSGSPQIPDMLIDPPMEEKNPFQQFNLGLYFKMLDDDLQQAVGVNQQPLVESTGDYGEPVTVDQPPAAPPATPAVAGPTPTMPVAAPAGPSVAPAAVPVVMAKPRARRGVEPPPPTAPAAVEQPTPSAGTPPPPPGARPPMRAPGT